jgi:quinol monooxygenase YgiN
MFIKPELRDDYLAALREFLILVRQEPGCIFLYASEAADEPGTIVVFERFRDPDEFNEILQRGYAQRYLKLSESAYAAPRVVVRLDRLSRWTKILTDRNETCFRLRLARRVCTDTAPKQR